MAEYDVTMEQAFPEVNPGRLPLGGFITVQLRRNVRRLASGLYVPDDITEANDEFTTTGKVIGMGRLACCNRETGEPWTEGVWYKVGDFVDVPRLGGFRFRKPIPDTHPKEWVIFCTLKDYEVFHLITEDPLKPLAYL